MDRSMLEHLLESNGINDRHEQAMFKLFISSILGYQMMYGVDTAHVKQYMSIVLTFIELIGEDGN